MRVRELLPAVARLIANPERNLPSPTQPSGDGRQATNDRELGDFRLIREIGRGGMGIVYEAEQRSMGRRVALKVLPFAALASEKSLQRFKNEVRAVAALDHPHIVSVYSVGEERGIHYFAMQLIRGQTLADMIAELRRELPEGSRSAARDPREDPTVDSHPVAPPPATARSSARARLTPPNRVAPWTGAIGHSSGRRARNTPTSWG